MLNIYLFLKFNFYCKYFYLKLNYWVNDVINDEIVLNINVFIIYIY